MPSSQTYAQEIQSIFNENLLIGRSSRYMAELRRPSPGADTLLYQNIQMNQSNVKFLSEVWHSVLRPEYCAETQETEMKDDMTDGQKEKRKKLIAHALSSFLETVFYLPVVGDHDLAHQLMHEFCDFFKKTPRRSSIVSINWIENKNLLDFDSFFTESLQLRQAWREFFQETDQIKIVTDFVDDMFLKTSHAIDRAAAASPVTQSYADQNLGYFASKIPFTDSQKNIFFSLLAFKQLTNCISLMSGLKNVMDLDKFYEVASSAWGERPLDWKSMIGPEGVLEAKGIVVFGDRPDVTMLSNLMWRVRDGYAVYLENHGSENRFWGKLIGQNRSISQPSGQTHSFPQLGKDFDNLKAVLSSGFNSKVLLIAPSGYGSTTLIDTLAYATGKSILKPSDPEDGVEATRTWSQMLDNVVVVFEHQKMDKNQKTVFGNSNNPEIWVAHSEDDVPQIDMEDFDLVVTLPQASYELRRKIAFDHLQDEQLAMQIAKSCPTPKSIMKVVQWSQKTGQRSWEDLSLIVGSMQKSILASKNAQKSLPLEMFHMDKFGFEMVVGCDGAVHKAKNIVSTFKNPERFKKLPTASIPKGVLLSGPPGTGKTHMVRAMAKEAGVPLLVASSAELAANPEKITDVFQEAKRQAPCILFFDEVDALGAKGKNRDGSPAAPERLKILNKFLAEIDGFEKMTGVLVVGATHRSENLDEALVRSGRLGWNIHLQYPQKQERVELLKLYAQVDGLDWDRLGRASAGMSPADINECISRASMFAVLDGSETLQTSHVMRAIDEMTWGEHLDKNVRTEEMYRTAVHEAGHALLAWKNKCDIDRICVQPTNQAMGFVRHFADEEKMSITFDEVKQNIQRLFGGLVAEEVVLGSRTLGASSDLEKVRIWSSKLFFHEGYSNQYTAGFSSIDGAPEHLNRLQEEKEQFIRDLKEQTTTILKNNIELIKTLAQHLVSQREISGEEFDQFMKQHQRLVFDNATQEMDLPIASVKKFRQNDPAETPDLFTPRVSKM